MGWNLLWIVFVACLLACSIGFKKFVWFMSIGYGLGIAAGGAAILCIFFSRLNWLSVFQCAVLLFYGIRLAYFLWSRERNSKAYNEAMKGVSDSTVPMPVMVAMWVFMGALYTMQVSPVFYRLYNGSTDIAVPLIGALISLAGACIEAMADKQKSEQKKKNPGKVAMEGLFRLCRCPNYFGELLMWLGVFIGGLTTYHGIGQWLMAVISFVAICGIMFNGAQRLEKRQSERYGDDPEFNRYCDTTPIIIPFVPLYHLNKKEGNGQS